MKNNSCPIIHAQIIHAQWADNGQVGANTCLLAGQIQSQGQSHILGRSARAASFLGYPWVPPSSSIPYTVLDSLPLGFFCVNRRNELLFHLCHCYLGFPVICSQKLFGLYAREFLFKGSSPGLEAALEQQSHEGPMCVCVWGGRGGFTRILGVFGTGRNPFSLVKDQALGRLSPHCVLSQACSAPRGLQCTFVLNYSLIA